jgi:hypothetical protein
MPLHRCSVWPLAKQFASHPPRLVTRSPLIYFFYNDQMIMPKAKSGKKELSAPQRDALLKTLKVRFEKNRHRHPGREWSTVQARLQAHPEKLWSLIEMERTGGEPDVVSHDQKTGEVVFYDCAEQTPKHRRSFCYDREALDGRKEFKPKNSALDVAAAMGVELLTEDEYLALQKLGEFDIKTSSWIKTPAEIRKLGGALYGIRRYNRVFIGSNGAESYYGSRAFRASLRV